MEGLDVTQTRLAARRHMTIAAEAGERRLCHATTLVNAILGELTSRLMVSNAIASVLSGFMQRPF
jgi:hypothetical protein